MIKRKLNSLQIGDQFHDSEIDNKTETVFFQIIGDHIYIIYNEDCILICKDVSNGNGVVVNKQEYSKIN